MLHQLTPVQRETHQRLLTEFPFYAKHTLKIKDKMGNIIPFVFNKEQEYIHTQIEQQIKDIGMVRAIILKGRQQGCSTYVGGRFYHKTTTQRGKKAFILSHRADTTNALFKMVKMFHGEAIEAMQPDIDTDNLKGLQFNHNSEYSVGTAKAGSVGRGSTIQYFHGSEVAFWEKSEEIGSGIFQSIADLPGTEVILESTANGYDPIFYQSCQLAMKGDGLYRLIFVPWFWHIHYQSKPNANYEPDEESVWLMKTYGLSIEQVYWRYLKLNSPDFKGNVIKFKQEYPCDPVEAFQVSTGDSLIPASLILAARKKTIPVQDYAPIIYGVDPAKKKDRKVIVVRQGAKVLEMRIIREELDDPSVRIGNEIIKLMKHYPPDRIFIDFAYGEGVISYLKQSGFGQAVLGIYFNESPLNVKYMNKRAEMYGEMVEWFKTDLVDIPDSDEMAMDLAVIPDFIGSSLGKLSLVSKEKIKKDTGGVSPDIADALALTFAYPVKNKIVKTRLSSNTYTFNTRVKVVNSGNLKSLDRKRKA